MFSKSTICLLAIALFSDEVVAHKVDYRPPAGTAPWYKTATENSWIKPTWKVDYFVPNFGVDHDIKTTQAHIAETEKNLKHKFTATFKKPKGHPVDYFVPNFGLDHDILASKKHMADLEKKHGKWTPKQDANGVW